MPGAGSGHDRCAVIGQTLLPLLIGCLLAGLLAGCAPRQPAPVEDRSPGHQAPPVQRLPAPPFYEVQRGDTLYSIAFRFGLDWRRVAEWNRITAPYTIRPGQELRLSAPPAVVASTPPPPPPPRTTPPEPSPPRPAATPAPAPRSEPAPAPRAEPPSPAAGESGGATRSVAGVVWQWPTVGRISRPFDPAATRRGLGITGQLGQPVVAAADGEVVYSGTALIGYGELVIIKHSESMLSAYGHNRRRLVEEGDRVRRGQAIAELGMNERDEEILHFEIRRNGQAEDPMRFLPPRN
ncbi:MAG: LysM peptidoglycan-binding domain-containing protein [Wenzhouxiangella sp.]|nr:MAG: LysM peptidoglycan-binding domain-containing protein [Wenzhouxiangella sp.]